MALRIATDTDRETVRRWRNHRVVRQASMHQDLISHDEHAQWWGTLAHDRSRCVLIYVQDGIDCGVVTFQRIDRESRSAYWGFYLDNDGLEAREGTLRAWMQIQREAVAYADTVLDLETLDSDVLDGNAGVLKFNQRNNCRIVGQRDVEVGGRSLHIVELRRSRPAGPQLPGRSPGPNR